MITQCSIFVSIFCARFSNHSMQSLLHEMKLKMFRLFEMLNPRCTLQRPMVCVRCIIIVKPMSTVGQRTRCFARYVQCHDLTTIIAGYIDLSIIPADYYVH